MVLLEISLLYVNEAFRISSWKGQRHILSLLRHLWHRKNRQNLKHSENLGQRIIKHTKVKRETKVSLPKAKTSVADLREIEEWEKQKAASYQSWG